MSAVSIIFGIVVLGFVILVLTGMGILTTAIFKISPATKSGQDASKIAALKLILEGTTPTISSTKIDQAIALFPTSEVETGEYTIDLKDPNLTITKISLITFWILILISVIGLKMIF
jgi:hypothetical protein